MANYSLRTRMTSGRGREWKWQVTGYASNRHPKYPLVKYGDLLVQTVHQTDSSKDIELEVWRARMWRGEVAYVTVINKWTYESETIVDSPAVKGKPRNARGTK
jgi:cell wall-associated NlpC family hydrolase